MCVCVSIQLCVICIHVSHVLVGSVYCVCVCVCVCVHACVYLCMHLLCAIVYGVGVCPLPVLSDFFFPFSISLSIFLPLVRATIGEVTLKGKGVACVGMLLSCLLAMHVFMYEALIMHVYMYIVYNTCMQFIKPNKCTTRTQAVHVRTYNLLYNALNSMHTSSELTSVLNWYSVLCGCISLILTINSLACMHAHTCTHTCTCIVMHALVIVQYIIMCLQ